MKFQLKSDIEYFRSEMKASIISGLHAKSELGNVQLEIKQKFNDIHRQTTCYIGWMNEWVQSVLWVSSSLQQNFSPSRAPLCDMWFFFGRELEDLEKKLKNQVLDALDKER